MSRYISVNGRFVPYAHAATHVEDRGYQLGDGVYEVIACYEGRMVDGPAHLTRLDDSLQAIDIPPPLTTRQWQLCLQELMRRNRLSEGMIYIQVTRGVAPRQHNYPTGLRPTLVTSCKPLCFSKLWKQYAPGVTTITAPDHRWHSPHIKSINLLANLLGKQAAQNQGAYEQILIRDGYITETNVANVWIVDAQGHLCTPVADGSILSGITRMRLLALLDHAGIAVTVRPIHATELPTAQEVFLSSSIAGIIPVIMIDAHPVADGSVGSLTQKAQACYHAFFTETSHDAA